jgi:hypothetical protein
MESSRNRAGEIGEDVMIILVTVAQLIFFTRFHRYISWPTTAADGTVTRLSMLTDGYFTWLPFVIAASILVILASIVMIIWDSIWFRQAAWVGFCLIGITVVVSLLAIFPFDFSVIPNATAVEVVPKVVTVFLILQVTFYGVAAVVLFVRLKRSYGQGGS